MNQQSDQMATIFLFFFIYKNQNCRNKIKKLTNNNEASDFAQFNAIVIVFLKKNTNLISFALLPVSGNTRPIMRHGWIPTNLSCAADITAK